jgi:molecular chaperone GrpE
LEREASEIRKFASEAVLLKLLPTIDNLQRALKSLPKDLESNAWVKGIVALEQQFLKEVGDMGLKRFESVGKPLDAERHEVLMQVPGASGTVIEVLEDGYELHGKVVRPAKVKVGGA